MLECGVLIETVGFTPTWGVGCRRITPGDPYMEAIQKENVDVHFTAVKKITEDGVVGEDGVERKVDTVVCATGRCCHPVENIQKAVLTHTTGFDVSYRQVVACL